MSGDFYVLRCKGCGLWGVKEIRIDIRKSNFTCKSCRKVSKIKSTKSLGIDLLNHGPYEHPMEASEKCRELNGRR